eukprot:10582110-Alexandrium_andersonii.AAC.1
MSASLVGSEMCIRDRLRVPHGGLRIEADCSRDWPWADCGLHFEHIALYLSLIHILTLPTICSV